MTLAPSKASGAPIMTVSMKIDIATSGANNGLFVTTGIQNAANSQIQQVGFVQPMAFGNGGGGVAAALAAQSLPSTLETSRAINETSHAINETTCASVLPIAAAAASTIEATAPVSDAAKLPPVGTTFTRIEETSEGATSYSRYVNRYEDAIGMAPLASPERLSTERSTAVAPARILSPARSPTRSPTRSPARSPARSHIDRNVDAFLRLQPFPRINTFGDESGGRSSTAPYVQHPSDLVLNDTTTTTTTVEVFRANADSPVDFYKLPPAPTENDGWGQLVRAR